MKKILPIFLLASLMCQSCIKDDLEACSEYIHLHFSYMYGGTNRFFETVSSPTTVRYYKDGELYRTHEIGIDEIDLNTPYRFMKTLEDGGELELAAWTHDDALDYVNFDQDTRGEGYVKLKEITEGSGICRPVSDLLYGYLKFDAGDRLTRTVLTVPFERAVCRMRLTMTPRIQSRSTHTRPDGAVDTRAEIPNGGDITFLLYGTRSGVNEQQVANDDEVTLQPECRYDEATGNVVTDWFGAFSSEDKYLKVEVQNRGEKVAEFDCTPIEVTATPGDFIDLNIDGTYVRPIMEIRVNGWKMATIKSIL